MKKILILSVLLFSNFALASGTTKVQADTLFSSDHTKTWTPPAATDTLVGRASTDTLTNKTINALSNTVTNVSLTAGVTGTLPTGNGGTGQTSLNSTVFSTLFKTIATTGGDLIYGGSSGTPTRLANGSSGQVLTSAGGTSAPTWSTPSAAAPAFVYTQSNYTMTSADSTVIADVSTGSSITITLPPTQITGQKFLIKRFDNNSTSYSNGSVTFSGLFIANASVNYSNISLNTPGESYELQSRDGTNLYMVHHETETEWFSYTPNYTGFGTVSTSNARWRRVGDTLEMKGTFVAGTTTATKAEISFPTFGTGAISSSSNIVSPVELCGKLARTVPSTTFFGGGTILCEPSVAFVTMSLENSTAGALTEANGSIIASSGQTISWFAKVQISQWKP